MPSGFFARFEGLSVAGEFVQPLLGPNGSVVALCQAAFSEQAHGPLTVTAPSVQPAVTKWELMLR